MIYRLFLLIIWAPLGLYGMTSKPNGEPRSQPRRFSPSPSLLKITLQERAKQTFEEQHKELVSLYSRAYINYSITLSQPSKYPRLNKLYNQATEALEELSRPKSPTTKLREFEDAKKITQAFFELSKNLGNDIALSLPNPDGSDSDDLRYPNSLLLDSDDDEIDPADLEYTIDEKEDSSLSDPDNK